MTEISPQLKTSSHRFVTHLTTTLRHIPCLRICRPNLPNISPVTDQAAFHILAFSWSAVHINRDGTLLPSNRRAFRPISPTVPSRLPALMPMVGQSG